MHLPPAAGYRYRTLALHVANRHGGTAPSEQIGGDIGSRGHEFQRGREPGGGDICGIPLQTGTGQGWRSFNGMLSHDHQSYLPGAEPDIGLSATQNRVTRHRFSASDDDECRDTVVALVAGQFFSREPAPHQALDAVRA